MPRTLALATALGLGLALANSAQAFDFPFHTLPGEVPAYDFKTGGPYMAPPVPYGHYAKDSLGSLHKFLSCPSCHFRGLSGGGLGHGMFHHGDGDGHGGSGFGHGHGNSSYVADDGYGGIGHGYAGGLPVGTAVVGGYSAGAVVVPTGQSVVQPSIQSICGQPGCGVKSGHSHFGKSACGSCGGAGCGACGFGSGHGHGRGTGCGHCGGKGCGHCLSGLGSSLHGKLASLTGLLHHPKITWFVGAGGPVPLTPGYVPYVVSTRSPRDFFAFAPMNPNDR